MHPIETWIDEHDGVARTRELVRRRSDAVRLSALVDQGALVRVGRGVYARPTAPSDVVAASRLDGALTCRSLLRRLRLPLLDDDGTAHVAVHPHRAAPGWATDVRLHWTSELRASGSRAAPVALALRHALTCLPFREVVAATDAALTRGLVTVPELVERRPPTGVVTFQRWLAAVDARSGSLPETFLRLGLREVGLDVEPQPLVHGVGRVDLLVEGRVVVEADGFEFHQGGRSSRRTGAVTACARRSAWGRCASRSSTPSGGPTSRCTRCGRSSGG